MIDWLIVLRYVAYAMVIGSGLILALAVLVWCVHREN